MPGSDTWQFLGKALGANPTPMAFNEVYLGLQTGTIDGQDNPLPTVRAAKFYEVTEQIVLTSHLVDSLFFAIAKPFYDGLTPGQQIRVKNAARAAVEFNDQNVLLEEQDNVAFLKEQGLEVTTPDVEAFRKRVQKMYLEFEFSKDWPPGLLDRINATQRMSRARLDAMAFDAKQDLPAPAQGRRAGCGGDVRGHVRRLPDPDRDPLRARSPAGWTLEFATLAYVWMVFFAAAFILQPATTSPSTCSTTPCARAARRILALAQSLILADHLPDRAAGRARLRHLHEPREAPGSCRSRSASRFPASSCSWSW